MKISVEFPWLRFRGKEKNYIYIRKIPQIQQFSVVFSQCLSVLLFNIPPSRFEIIVRIKVSYIAPHSSIDKCDKVRRGLSPSG